MLANEQNCRACFCSNLTSMDKTTAELITKRLVETLSNLGVDAGEFAKRIGKYWTGRSPTKAEQALAQDAFQKSLTDMILETSREPSPQELAQVLTKIRKTGPEMRKHLMEVAKSIPPQAGGRPRELAENNAEARLCALISQQLADGVEKPEAIQNSARRFEVSYWTAKRAWKRYQDAMSLKNVSLKKSTRKSTRRKNRT